jgi:nucleoside-diphosphate-sugar epimerase
VSRRVLVTGAAGFLGRHTLAPLLAAGLDVHAVSSRPAPPLPSPSSAVGDGPRAEVEDRLPSAVGDWPPAEVGDWPPAGVHWHRADLLAPESAAQLVREVRPTHLLHLAWCTQPGAFWISPANLDWVQASLRLLRAFGEVGGRRAVVAGTCAEYQWQRDTHCVERRTPLRPATLYGAAKHGLHVIADGWAAQAGVALAWGRIFFLYGPHEHPDRLVSSVARALLRGEEARCTHGRQLRDFLYAPDLAAAFAALLLSDVTGPLNMASGESVRIADVVNAIAQATGRPELVRLGSLPANPHEPERLTADVRRLREEVGWTPAVPLRAGAEWTVSWWREQLRADARVTEGLETEGSAEGKGLEGEGLAEGEGSKGVGLEGEGLAEGEGSKGEGLEGEGLAEGEGSVR